MSDAALIGNLFYKETAETVDTDDVESNGNVCIQSIPQGESRAPCYHEMR